MHIENYSLDNMCEVLDISKRTYYKYRAAEDKDYYDYLLIKEILMNQKVRMDIVGFVKAC